MANNIKTTFIRRDFLKGFGTGTRGAEEALKDARPLKENAYIIPPAQAAFIQAPLSPVQ